MILVDTSVWIEFLKHHPPYFHTLEPLLEKQGVVAVECIFGELLQGVKNSREQTMILDYWENLPKKDERGLWLEAGILSSSHKCLSKGVGLIDAFLICFARTYRLQIWTLDKKLTSVLKPTENFHPSF